MKNKQVAFLKSLPYYEGSQKVMPYSLLVLECFQYQNCQLLQLEKKFIELPSLFLHIILFQNGCSSEHTQKTNAKFCFCFFLGGGRSTLDINTVQRQVSKVDGSSKEKGETDLSDRLYSGRSAAAVDVDKTKTALKH